MTGLQRLSQLGSWVVVLIALAATLYFAFAWLMAILYLMAWFKVWLPPMPQPAYAILSDPMTLYGIVAVAIPYLLALRGLRHLHRLLSSYAKNNTALLRHDATIFGISLVGIAATLVLVGAALTYLVAGRLLLPVLPIHIALFAAGAAVLVIARWRSALQS